VFDNIPLTALALKQGGYDWGFLAYAVGFGGSMIWFGSSAGVALANMFPRRARWACGCATAGHCGGLRGGLLRHAGDDRLPPGLHAKGHAGATPCGHRAPRSGFGQ
jgi:hypothetical protein